MDEKNMKNRIHSLKMSSRERLFADGVEDVESFSEEKIIACTIDGQMTIKGAELKINRLSVEDGELEIQGIIDSIEYQDPHQGSGQGFWSKIFK